MTASFRLLLALSTALFIAGCGGSDDGHDDHDGHDHGDHAHGNPPTGEQTGDNNHDVFSDLPDAKIGAMTAKLQQGHGEVVAGEESHLVVKLPGTAKGALIVRAWIGTEDRTLSRVGAGVFDADHDAFDVHAIAPDPLPEGAMWWIEVQKPDGTKALGSTTPIIGS